MYDHHKTTTCMPHSVSGTDNSVYINCMNKTLCQMLYRRTLYLAYQGKNGKIKSVIHQYEHLFTICMRDTSIVEDQNPLFPQFIFEDHLLSRLVLPCIVIVLKKIEESILVDERLPQKQQKLHPSKICMYTVCNSMNAISRSYQCFWLCGYIT